MLSDTTYLDCRPLLIYFLPQLPDFLTTNTFMSCRSWLTSSTLTPLIILYKTPSEAQVLKISVVFFQIVPLLYWIFMSNKSHSKLNISLSFRGGRIAVNIIIFFQALNRRGKNTSNEQDFRLCYVLNHQMRDSLFHYYFQFLVF